MTSTIDAANSRGSSGNQQSQKTEVGSESKPKPVITGREILMQYLKGDTVALMTYRKICNALEILPTWEKAAKIQFLEQFLNISNILNERCADLVAGLARLNWQVIPEEIVERYLNMLCDVAIRHVCHVETVYGAAVNNFIPVVKEDKDEGTVLAISVEEQDKFYGMAHRIIAHVLKCFPMSSKALLRTLKNGVPHLSHSYHSVTGYIRNLLQCLEYIKELRADIWELIIDQMVLCDNMLTKVSCKDDIKSETDAVIFHMDEDLEKQSAAEESELMSKLDGVMQDVLCYISLKHHVQIDIIDSSWLRIGSDSNAEEIFSILLSLLESRMLLSVHVRYTSFIWIYLCGLYENYATRMLELLWSVVIRPQVAQADVAKAHGAAAYLAGLLARAKYFDVRVASSWMHRIVKWCIKYVENCAMASSKITAGVLRHGTFYALCQALFIIFSFRYKELVQTEDINRIRRWGLGRIVHSPLDPLKYVSRPVGQCFAAIGRSLQLVYCTHVLPFDAGENLPFEPMFPFDSYKLKSSAALICPLLRRFSPMAEHKSAVSSALQSLQEKGLQEHEMDFLDEEDAFINDQFCNRSPVKSPPLFTVYSTSPGLKSFDNLMDMR
ncbi:hypothetical protein KIN20_011670 [Parelaphostrongylus tenuis]|uniref:RNA polymerase I-specific transcription initiation factor RRN3 n=1 Tax=Parelaphostrongylus tenuis TaxID=148309 RepID=A0AAD5QJV4_PARTN|nr:hypothetical protein KIN20_011670 [Parelaphostrongylus tenuis]